MPNHRTQTPRWPLVRRRRPGVMRRPAHGPRVGRPSLSLELAPRGPQLAAGRLTAVAAQEWAAVWSGIASTLTAAILAAAVTWVRRVDARIRALERQVAKLDTKLDRRFPRNDRIN